MNKVCIPYLRNKVLEEACSWLGTPFHHLARVKGAGVDCGQYLIAVGSVMGLMEDIPIKYFTAGEGYYTRDFAYHRSEEWYTEIVMRYCKQVTDPLPGDLVLYKVGRLFSHGGWIIDWPKIIHAYVHMGVCYADGTQGWLRAHQSKFFSPLAYENR